MNDRYHRQTLLPQIGTEGQARLRGARVLLVGCGALGTVIADQLVRAGVGFLRIVDRDVVEMTNLQRQVLFDEDDAINATPKALAAAARLSKINSGVTIDPVPADVHGGNIEDLAGVSIRNPQSTIESFEHPRGTGIQPVFLSQEHGLEAGATGESKSANQFDLILDGTDNVATRYLINDVSAKHGVPWVYGAAVGTEGRAMLVLPGTSACLRCVFPEPMNPGELPTCDTAGVLAPASAIVASYQTTLALRQLVGRPGTPALLSVDVWAGRFKQVDLTAARRADCPCCGRRQFDFLNAPAGDSSTTLCGSDTVQIRPGKSMQIDLNHMAERWARVGSVQHTKFFVRCEINDGFPLHLTLFNDGRLLVRGTTDPTRAKAIYARFLGA